MFLKNSWALLALAFLIGIATNLGLIGAQSDLLSHADAVYTIYGSVAGGLLYSLFLKNFHLVKVRYAHFAVAALIVFSILLATLTQDWLSGMVRAVAWFTAAMFGFDLLRWIVSELTLRYLDPARANAYFSYLNSFFEGGTVLLVLLLKFNGIVLNPNQTLLVIIACCLASAVLLAVQFFPKKNFEIVYSSSAKEAPAEAQGIKRLMVFFVMMTVAFAAIEVSEDYLAKIVVKDRLQSYEAIRSMTDSYFSLSCALIVLLSFVTGKAIEAMRVSPIRLLQTYASLMIGFCLLCFATNYFYLFIAFEVTRRVSEYCLYSPGNQMLMGSFSSDLRPKIRAQHSFYYYVVVPVIMAGAFSLTNHLPIRAEQSVVLFMILISSLSALFVLVRFRNVYTATMYSLLDSSSKAAAIIAAHTLSYIRPPDYVHRMNEILTRAPKKLLRKTIILGLAYVHTDDSIDLIESQFQTDKEEIQLAAVDALRISGRLKATQFMLNILLQKARTKTQRVRLNAMTAIGALYGKKSIPLLLNGLEDEDPRAVANALEVLGYFKNAELKAYFLKYVDSDVPRIRANALMGLSRYRDTRLLFENLVRESFRKADVSLVSSLLFVIGQAREKVFREDILQMYEVPRLRYDPRLVNAFAWVLIRLNDVKGFELANEIISTGDEKHQSSFMHFFSLHDPETRYDIIKYFVNKHCRDPEVIHKAGDLLKASVYDFHEELQYLKVYSESVPPSAAISPAPAA